MADVPDVLAPLRAKTRMIAELRYPAVPQFLDIRGNVIAAIFPQVEKDLPYWESQPNAVLFGDAARGKIKDEMYLSPNRFAIIMEDPPSIEAFKQRVERYLPFVIDALKPLQKVDRFGVRVVEVLACVKCESADDVRQLVLKSFHKLPQGLPLQYEDSLARIVHDHGSITVGPATPDEQWIQSVFLRPNENVPAFGLGLDIDTAVTGVKLFNKKADLGKAFRALMEMWASIELAVAGQAGLSDD